MKVLVVDDDETLRLSLCFTLETRGHLVDEACDGESAIAMVEQSSDYGAVILDVNMPKLDGIAALEKVKQINPKVCCIILTAHSQVKDAVKAIKLGAFDYLEKPFETDHILSIIDSAKEANEMVEAAAFSAPKVQFDEGRTMIGASSEINRIFEVIYKLSKVDTAVLVRGESGTGKELVARALHYNSHRKKGPFVAVNCAALAENLIESELFGYEKGAFTGADKKKVGKFKFADGGTLFLDEIGDIPATMQAKLLRVLQEKVFFPIGSNIETSSDVRIIAATNRNLEQMIVEGEFREDLFYRLNILPIMLPPLRQRIEDLSELVAFMIKKFNLRHQRSIEGISDDALKAITHYKWPGNIRELENVIEHAFILESSETLTSSSLPDFVAKTAPSQEPAQTHERIEGEQDGGFLEGSLNYPELKEQFERDFLIRALKAFAGRINKTALHTKMTKMTLLRKLGKYGINARDYQ